MCLYGRTIFFVDLPHITWHHLVSCLKWQVQILAWFFFTPGSEIDSSTKRSPEESSVGTLTNEGSGVAFEEVAAVPDGGFESSAFSKLLDLV